MPMRPSHLQALYARRREIEHNRIERTEAVNKYFDHWGKVTARFENWTTPEYYQQAENKLQNTRDQKEKLKSLQERQQKLTKLLAMEKKMYEEELQERERNPRRSIDTKMLEKITENLKEQQQMRRKLELEAKLYGKWRHGVDDDNLIFESKSDNETLAKLNWLDKQVNQQLQKEQEQKKAKELDLKLQLEFNKTEELQKERQRIREKEIREIRCLQEYHMDELKERQKETDALKEKEKQLKGNLEDLEKELELLEESFKVLGQKADLSGAFNLNKIKLLLRKRSEDFRNQIKLCLSIVERTSDFAEKPESLRTLKTRLETELEKEAHKFNQIETMYESEARHSLRRNEELWHSEHENRYRLIKQALMDEHHFIKTTLNDIMKKHEELLEIKSTHLGIIENSSKKLKLLIQEEENSPRYRNQQTKQATFAGDNFVHTQLEESENTPFDTPHRLPPSNTKLQKSSEFHHTVNAETLRNCEDSNNSNLSPRCFDVHDCNDIEQASNLFNNLNFGKHSGHPSRRELEDEKTNAQRSMQVVSAETEAERPRFGRKHLAWN